MPDESLGMTIAKNAATIIGTLIVLNVATAVYSQLRKKITK